MAEPAFNHIVSEGLRNMRETVTTNGDAHAGGDAHNDDARDGDVNYGTAYETVRVLVLTFAFHDLGSVLETERRDVCEAFESMGYDTEFYYIPMRKSQRCLRQRLARFLKQGDARTLLIIYYHGHGACARLNQSFAFTIASHTSPSKGDEDSEPPEDIIRKLWAGLEDSEETRRELRSKYERYQRAAFVVWEDISDDILDSERDTLTILDCCAAGLALPVNLEEFEDDGTDFCATRNELLVACTWSNSTSDRMTPAMITTLKRFIPGPDYTMSGETLVRGMNNQLATEYISEWKLGYKAPQIPQAAHYLMRRTKKRRIMLPNLRANHSTTSSSSSSNA